LESMNPDGALINTARGGLVVERDLLGALKSGQIAGAGLDVFEEEPTDPKNPLYELDNVIVSAHVAGNDELSLVEMGLEAAQCIVDLHDGVWPGGSVVNRDLEGRWSW
jgi:D-3-phosphoglycerate dehydrogenase